MFSHLNAVKLNDHVYWVGAIDWSVRDFHGYSTQRGSTYNAYLVLADSCHIKQHYNRVWRVSQYLVRE